MHKGAERYYREAGHHQVRAHDRYCTTTPRRARYAGAIDFPAHAMELVGRDATRQADRASRSFLVAGAVRARDARHRLVRADRPRDAALSSRRSSLALMLPICFVTTTLHPRVDIVTPVDWFLGLAGSAAAIWFALSDGRISNWMAGFSELETRRLHCRVRRLSLLTIEICRRTVGVGPHRHRCLFAACLCGVRAFAEQAASAIPPVTLCLLPWKRRSSRRTAYFGSPLYVAASYAFLFVLVRQFLMC